MKLNFHKLAFLKPVHELCISFMLLSDMALVIRLRLDSANLYVQFGIYSSPLGTVGYLVSIL